MSESTEVLEAKIKVLLNVMCAHSYGSMRGWPFTPVAGGSYVYLLYLQFSTLVY